MGYIRTTVIKSVCWCSLDYQERSFQNLHVPVYCIYITSHSILEGAIISFEEESAFQTDI